MKYDISGAILAGGKSSRMGFNKAFLEVNGRRIIDRTIDIFSTLFNEIIIVTDNPDNYKEFAPERLRERKARKPGTGAGGAQTPPAYGNIRVVEDIYKAQGPLGGIYTGLQYSCFENVFFAASDMPFLHNGLIDRLCHAASEGAYDCVIPLSDKGIEPLCGIYNKRLLDLLDAAISLKELSVTEFLSGCNCRYLKAGPDECISFYNINTKEDLDRLKSPGNNLK